MKPDFFDVVRASLAHRAAIGLTTKNKGAGQRFRHGAQGKLNPDYTTGNPGFDRSLLPEAGDFYRQLFGDDMRATSKGWQVRCPFHDDRTPSATAFRDGGFHCHACGVHCRDVLDFHQRMTGLSFKAAAQALGAWRTAR